MSREHPEGTAGLLADSEQQARQDDTRDRDARQQDTQGRPDMQQQEPMAREARRDAGGAQQPQQPQQPGRPQGAEQLAALFRPEVASQFRNHWDQIQIGFVDDPRSAVQQADELVAQVMKSLAASFAEQRSRLEAGLGSGGGGNTEDLRVALQSYRSFFQRLLSL